MWFRGERVVSVVEIIFEGYTSVLEIKIKGCTLVVEIIIWIIECGSEGRG